MELEVQHQAASPASPAKCTTCEMLAHAPLVCQDCHQLLAHVQGADYFEVFGLPRRYRVDTQELDRRYLGISRNIHPDKYAAAGAEMQAFALRMSAAVNRAHDVLRDSFLRAEYLLESAGGPSAAQDKRVPADLLNQVMTLREEIEEAKGAKDENALDRIRQSVGRQQRETEASIGQLCDRLDGASTDTQAELRRQLNALKYLNNLLAQL
jgi:molecular chaperone HscB